MGPGLPPGSRGGGSGGSPPAGSDGHLQLLPEVRGVLHDGLERKWVFGSDQHQALEGVVVELLVLKIC